MKFCLTRMAKLQNSYLSNRTNSAVVNNILLGLVLRFVKFFQALVSVHPGILK